jgi:hypothetical protein
MGSDPVSLGLVASLNRPGGNATGMTLLSGPLLVKRVELARDLLPRPDLLAVLTNPTNPENDDDLRYVQEAARVIGQRLLVLEASFDTTASDTITGDAKGTRHLRALQTTFWGEFRSHTSRSNLSRSAALIEICSIFLIGAESQVCADL